MAAKNRERCIALTLAHEGGYTNHPSDPGGPTNWGITIHDAKAYWKANATAADVKAMPKSVAVSIYKVRYWDRMGCDDDPMGVDYATYDYGVNSGVGRGIPVRNRLKNADPVKWVKAICAERMSFLMRLKTWSVFGKGWGRRVAAVEAVGVKMALEGLGKSPSEVTKDLKNESKNAGKKRDNAVVKGTVPGGGAIVVDGAATWGTNVTVALVVIAVGVAVYFGLRAYREHQRQKAYQNVLLQQPTPTA